MMDGLDWQMFGEIQVQVGVSEEKQQDRKIQTNFIKGRKKLEGMYYIFKRQDRDRVVIQRQVDEQMVDGRQIYYRDGVGQGEYYNREIVLLREGRVVRVIFLMKIE